MSKLAGAFPLNWIEPLFHSASKASQYSDIPIAAACIDPISQISVLRANRVEQDRSGLAHAECLALHSMQEKLGTRYLTNCILVSTLEPCTMCLGVAVQLKLSGIVYFLRDAKAGYFSHHHILVSSQAPSRYQLGSHHFWVRVVEQKGTLFYTQLRTFFQNLR